MQATKLPEHVCNSLDKMNWDDFWNGGDVESKKLYMVSWNKICQPKALDGLGFQQASRSNNAFMAKLGWQVVTGKGGKLWVNVIKHKYLKGRSLLCGNDK